MTNRLKLHLGICFIAALSFACTSKTEEKTEVKVNKAEVKEISKQVKNTKIHRYDLALKNINKDSLASELTRLQAQYRFFLGDHPDEPSNVKQIEGYLNDPTIKKLYKETGKVFADMSPYEQQFDQSFALLKYHFPEAKIPEVYTAITGLYYEMPIMCYDSVMVIALDLFLGQHYSLYKQIQVPQYIFRRFSKEYLISDCFKELSYQYIAYQNATSLLNEMIFEGKRMIFVQAMAPNTPDSIIFGFQQKSINWAKKNEGNVWAYLIEKNLLYNKDKNVIIKLVNDAPFTSFFGKESPGKIGAWLGWQICRSWIKNNPDKTLKDLLQEKDAQKVLVQSKYKPKI